KAEADEKEKGGVKWERRGPAHGGARGQPEREQGERGAGDSEKGAVRNLPSEGRVEDSLRPDPRQGGASDQCLAECGEGPVAAEICHPDHRGIIALRRPPRRFSRIRTSPRRWGASVRGPEPGWSTWYARQGATTSGCARRSCPLPPEVGTGSS